ncbi:hypothetical protein ALNOE001_17270 [Candidatus Methanobinarius endosymbioticus]|uniref:Right handed beta helix domain-containing protein n=1 Tax=Candidatus Methanobinarius endosymbioticus TaxID=2006182 RepID=A0A366M9M6_9EURY|nr:hypothetical protein ALNOE001_17270 [Candidatus Methanobinarius endosymbioticus]
MHVRGDSNTITSNVISKPIKYGIYLRGNKNTSYNNKIAGKTKKVAIGIYSYKGSKHNTIKYNAVANFKHGICIKFDSKTNKISKNKIINNRFGLSTNYKFKNSTNIIKGNIMNIRYL